MATTISSLPLKSSPDDDDNFIIDDSVDGNSKRVRLQDITSSGINSGTTANRPAHVDIAIGFEYFDTDLGHPIWSDGTNWVDATGTVV